jgi:hypothetical protein
MLNSNPDFLNSKDKTLQLKNPSNNNLTPFKKISLPWRIFSKLKKHKHKKNLNHKNQIFFRMFIA